MRDPRNPLCFVGFPFAEVLLNRRNSLEPAGFGGFRALSDFRARGPRRRPPGGAAGGARGPSAMLGSERGAGY